MANIPANPSSADPRLSGVLASVQESAAAIGYVVEQVVVRPAAPHQQTLAQSQAMHQQQQVSKQESVLSQHQPLPPQAASYTSTSAHPPPSISIAPAVPSNALPAASALPQPSQLAQPQPEHQFHALRSQHLSHERTQTAPCLHPPQPNEYSYRHVNHLDLQLPPAATSPVSPVWPRFTSPATSSASTATQFGLVKREIGSFGRDASMLMQDFKRSRAERDLGPFSLGTPEERPLGSISTFPSVTATSPTNIRGAPPTIDGGLIDRLRGFSSASGRLQGMPNSPVSARNSQVKVESPDSVQTGPPSPMDITLNSSTKIASGGVEKVRQRGLSRTTAHGTQSSERPYGCKQCPTSFGRKDNLKKHVRMIHLNERPFPCKLCGYPFQKKDHLLKHIRTVHEKKRPFSCDKCGNTFGQKSDLTKHIRTVHEKQRPFHCKQCGMSFGHKGNLMRHVWVVHEKQRPYSCMLCTSEFGEKSNLDKHIRQVHQKPQLTNPGS